MLSMRSGSYAGNSRNPVGVEPKFVRRFVAIAIAPIWLLIAAGCAKQNTPPSPHLTSDRYLPPAEATRHAYAEVELEDDGREAQQPPLVTRAPLPDDPTEPFSPNYGRVSSWQSDPGSQNFEAANSVAVTPISVQSQAGFQNSMMR